MDVVSICNLALSRIGKKASISSIDPADGSDEANACARMYPLALGTILDAHNWSFATARTSLAKYADVDAAPWQYAYGLPNNCLRVIDLQPSSEETTTEEESTVDSTTGYLWRYTRTVVPGDGQPYEFEVVNTGKTLALLTDLYMPVCRYVMREPPTSFFSASFTDALAWLLASYLAGLAIRGETSFNFCIAAQRQYEALLQKAMRQDATQIKSRPKVAPYSVRSRYGYQSHTKFF